MGSSIGPTSQRSWLNRVSNRVTRWLRIYEVKSGSNGGIAGCFWFWWRQNMRHPNPSAVKSFTTAPSNCTTTLMGKVRGDLVLQVSRVVLTGFTAQVLASAEI